MTVLLVVKMLCDFSYYFLFAHYFGSFAGVHYNLFLTLAALTAAGVLSALLEKKGRLRLLPTAAATLVLLQCRGIADVLVLLPAVIYLWVFCIKCRYWPDESEYRDVFSIQWKTLLVPVPVAMITADLSALQQNCLPLVIVFLTAAILLLRMLRHSAAVLNTPRFQIQNAVTVVLVVLAAFWFSSDLFLTVLGKAVGYLRVVITPVLEVLVWCLATGISWLWKAVMYIVNLIRRMSGAEEPEPTKIKEPKPPTEDLDMEQTDPPTGETFAKVLIVLGVIAALIAAAVILKKMLGRRGKKDGGAGFSQSDIVQSAEKRDRDRLTAPKEPRAAVRWHYRRFLKYCRSKELPVTKYCDSAQVNRMANSAEAAQSTETEPLRDIYIAARYSDNAVSEDDAKKAKELVKRIKEGN